MQDEAARTLATRLHAAIRRWGGSRAVASFSRAMQERGVRGATRENVHQVLGGREPGREPSLAFVRVAAEVLGVTPGWLAFGTGPVTPDEEAAQLALLRWALDGERLIGALALSREAVVDELTLSRGNLDA